MHFEFYWFPLTLGGIRYDPQAGGHGEHAVHHDNVPFGAGESGGQDLWGDPQEPGQPRQRRLQRRGP